MMVMARPATGQVVVRKRKNARVFALRFRAYGERHYVTLGSSADGWTPAKARTELENVLADVRRGIWKPPAPEPMQAPTAAPTFHVFASEWFERQKIEGGRRQGGLTGAGRADLEWRLSNHLLRAFADRRLDEITIEDVDRYRLAKVREGKLGATSINKTLTTLAAILESAVEYGLIDRNPARGRRRRLPAVTPRRPWLDRAAHIEALLNAAGTIDAMARHCPGQRRALLATLTFAGLRIGEALELRWGAVDLARGTMGVRAAKTEAGVRTVNVLPALRDELAAYRARLDPAPDELVFGTATGRRQGATNVRRRVLAPAAALANERLEGASEPPLPEGLTLHSLRRTFASLLFALGEAPPYVMAQMGHTTPHLTLAIYAREMDRRDGEPERLKALVEGVQWAPLGTSDAISPSPAAVRETGKSPKTRTRAGDSRHGRGWVRTSDLSRVKRALSH
jgi:integrase